MNSKRKQPGRRPAHERIRKLSEEHREVVLNCLACRWRVSRIIDYLQQEYAVEVRQASISYYKAQYAEEIAIRRRRYHEKSTSLDLPFIQQSERLAELSRQTSIELNRGRLKDARECMRAIAEETGDLKQTNNLNITRIEQKSSEELLAILEDALGKLEPAEPVPGG